ncbi:BnaC08g10510D [Brassica napus]|uniref:BnaC08g10510D protein n=1 Tax=Brassica napus TaxID=3708 RepID=A0A078HXK2_BRANA|nr:BnaC08g10510D [Brassica napus]
MASKKPVNRPSVRHPSHNHPLRVFKAQNEDEIICSGCELDLTGQAFKCTKDFLRTVDREDHKHPLTLLYKIPCEDGKMYVCDVCEEEVSENLWTYYCKECDYGTHVHSCALDEDYEKEEEENRESSSAASRMKSLMKAQDEIAAMKLESPGGGLRWFLYRRRCRLSLLLSLFPSSPLSRLILPLSSSADILSIVVSLPSPASLSGGEVSGAVVRRGCESEVWWLFRG